MASGPSWFHPPNPVSLSVSLQGIPRGPNQAGSVSLLRFQLLREGLLITYGGSTPHTTLFHCYPAGLSPATAQGCEEHLVS